MKARVLTTALALLALAACGQPAAPAPEPVGPTVAAAGEMCGGIAGIACGDGHYCQYLEGTCGAADQSGTCLPQPTDCTTGGEGGVEANSPVCGCDNTTYASSCAAAAAGVSVASHGDCGGAATTP